MKPLPFPPSGSDTLLDATGKLSVSLAKKVLAVMFVTGADPCELVKYSPDEFIELLKQLGLLKTRA